MLARSGRTDGFYGSANLNYNYEDPSNNSDDYIHGRFKDVRFNGTVWMEKYQEATGRPAAHIAAKAGEYPRTYTFSCIRPAGDPLSGIGG